MKNQFTINIPFLKRIIPVLLLLGLFVSWTFPAETEILYLSGTDKDHTVKWDFFCTDGMNSGRWTTIPVPSCWELQGFGHYNYGQDRKKADEQGKYRFHFRIPSSWAKKQVEIVFEGSMTDTDVWINGKKAGATHQGAFYRFSYDITKLAKAGEENLLEVTVSKMSADDSVNGAERRADFWVFGGIFRPVYLRAFPKEHIQRTAIDARADGSFSIDLYLSNIKNARAASCQIFTTGGKKISETFSAKISGGEKYKKLTTHVSDPNLWTAETPNLYQVDIALKEGSRVIHSLREKFGFRTIEVRKGEGIFVNGQSVKMKGVNRHSFWPSSGRTLSKQISVEDVNLMKDMNMNAVRMSHYPPDTHFLEVSDSLGLYVLDELTGWQEAYSTPVGKKLVKELVTRDVNHPSIIFWDNGNEGGFNYELDAEFPKYDPQKRVVLHPWEPANGVNTTHYRKFEMYKALADGPDILMPTEYLHGLYDGGLGAGLADFWNMAYQKPLAAGGFLWVFADEAVVRTDQSGRLDADSNHAPDGILSPYHQKEGSFYTIKEVFSPVHLKTAAFEPAGKLTLEIDNHYDFTNLNQCQFKYWLANFPRPEEKRTGAVRSGKIRSLNISLTPHFSKKISLPLPLGFKNSDALFFRAIDPSGRELYSWTFPLKKPADYVREIVKSSQSPVKGKETDRAIVVSTPHLELTFGKSRRGGALLQKVVQNGKTVSLGRGPLLAAGSGRGITLKHFREGANYVVESTYRSGNLKHLKWTVMGNGWVKLEYKYRLNGYYDYLGMSFSYPEKQVTGIKWLGQGISRVWKNRLKGTTLNVWHKKYNDAITGQVWDYPEFKGYYTGLNWLVIETTELPILVLTETDDLFFRMYTPKSGVDPRNTAPPFPRGDISFLQGIAPIGTKFTRPENLGPTGLKNFARGYYSATLYFHFGLGD